MKNFYLFLLTLLVTQLGYSQFTESFEGATIPTGWSVINSNAGPTWISGATPNDSSGNPIAAYDGAKCAQINSSGTSGHDDLLITPQISSVAAGVNSSISFYARNGSSVFSDSFVVLLSTTGNTAASNFTVSLTTANVVPGEGWTQYIFDIPSTYYGQNVHIAIKANTPNSNNQELDIDKFSNNGGPTCPKPTALVGSAVATGVQLSWTNGGTETQWEVKYGTGTFDPNTAGTLVPASSNPFIVTGLSSQTAYTFYVRAVCSTTDSSLWSNSVSVTTGCLAITPTYTQDFATFFPNCWTRAGAGTPATGPTGTANGLWAADGYLNVGTTGAARINLYATNRIGWMVSPPIDLGNGSTPYQLKFNAGVTTFAGTAASAMGSDDVVQVLISVNGGAWTNITTFNSTNVPSNTGGTYIFPLAAYTGVVKFAFYANDGAVNDLPDYDFFVDNFIVRPIPACEDVLGINTTAITGATATANWTASTTPGITYEIEYGVSGFTQGTGTVVTSTTNSYNFTGLNPVTNYCYYVRAVCTGSQYGPWSTSSCFTTTCANYVPVYTQDFATYLPQCWSEATNGTPITGPVMGDGNWAADGYLNAGFAGATKVNLFGTGMNEWLISPSIDLGTGTTQYEVLFDSGVTDWGNTNPSAMGSDDMVQLVISVNNGPWTAITTFNNSNVPPNTGSSYIFSLAAYTGIVKLAFYATNGTVNNLEDYDFFIDNFKVRPIPSCPQPTGITIANITTSSVDVSWTGPSNATEYEVRYVAAGQDPLTAGTLVTPNPTTNSVTISGLNHSTSYDIYVRSVCSATDLSEMTGPKNFRTRIPNDECSTAVQLTSAPIGDACVTQTAGTVFGASDSGVTACSGTADDDVWYKFTAISDKHVITISNVLGNQTNMVTQVFSGACGSLTSVQCSNTLVTNLTGLTIGQEYFVRVYTFVGTAADTTFNICITALAPLAPNDACSGAIVASTLPYTNTQTDFATSNNTGFITGCLGGMNDGVWYQFTGTGNPIVVEVDALESWNHEFIITDTPCGTNPVNCVGSSSFAGTGGTEITTINSVAGQVYYVVIGDISGLTDKPEGDFTINITETMGIEEIGNGATLATLYPNPTSGIINISTEKTVSHVSVHNLQGSLIADSLTFENGKVNVETLQSGIYFLNITFEDGTVESHKIIKK